METYATPFAQMLARARDAAAEIFARGEDVDFSDAAREEADCWDIVIYHHKALAVVASSWGGDLDRAEESLTDCGFTFESFGQTCTMLAYWLVYHAIMDAIAELEAEAQDAEEDGDE